MGLVRDGGTIANASALDDEGARVDTPLQSALDISRPPLRSTQTCRQVDAPCRPPGIAQYVGHRAIIFKWLAILGPWKHITV